MINKGTFNECLERISSWRKSNCIWCFREMLDCKDGDNMNYNSCKKPSNINNALSKIIKKKGTDKKERIREVKKIKDSYCKKCKIKCMSDCKKINIAITKALLEKGYEIILEHPKLKCPHCDIQMRQGKGISGDTNYHCDNSLCGHCGGELLYPKLYHNLKVRQYSLTEKLKILKKTIPEYTLDGDYKEEEIWLYSAGYCHKLFRDCRETIPEYNDILVNIAKNIEFLTLRQLKALAKQITLFSQGRK